MNGYQCVLDFLAAGMESLAAAMLSIYFYFISAGTLTANNMNETNLALIMSSLGYAYDTATDTFNDGEDDYTVSELLSAVITNYYESLRTLGAPTMNGLIITCRQHGKITPEEQSALLSLVQTVGTSS